MGKTKKSPIYPKHLSNFLCISNSQKTIDISLPSVEEVVDFLLKDSNQPQMQVHFVGKRKIAQLHKEFFSDPSPTDCITFPYEDPLFLGEVFICPQVALEYVEKNGGSLEEEITLYLIHGFLHLLGLDDQTTLQRKEMRAAEKKWSQKLAKNQLGVKINIK